MLPDVLESVGLREEAKRCREEGTAEAAAAADADAYAAYAADAARAAAIAVTDTATDKTLITACDCWVEAAEELKQ